MKNVVNIIRISKPLYKTIALSTILILAGVVLNLITPFISKSIVDIITDNLQNQTGDLNRLYFFIALGFIITLLTTLLNSLSNRVGDYLAGRLRKFLTDKYYDKVLSLPQIYFDSELSGKIVNQLNRGIFVIQGFMNRMTNFLLPTLLQSIFTIIILALYSLPVALFMIILFPIYITISYYSSKRWGKREDEKNKIEDVIRGRIQEVVSNIRLVKSFTNEKNEYDLISNNLEKSNEIYDKQSREFHIFDFFRNLSLSIILLGVNIVVFYNTFQGLFSIGTLVLLLQLVDQARRPLFAMSFILGQLQEAESGSKKYFEVLDLESKEFYNEDKNIKVRKIKDAEIEFKNVEFQYNEKDTVLNGVSFKVNKNQTVALVGPSGAGKTTIISLILKFYEPTKGEILVNGKNYKDLTAKFIRENIALVFQDNELFSSTIRENVAYGQTATDEEITRALKLANAYEFVKSFPEGINSQIGERGVKLSGGQKQRIQIARAILKNSPILILDEATSNLDAKSENEVQEAMENLTKDKLVIVIAHRFSTLQNADLVIVLNNHKIEDIGTPQELAKKEGIYSELLNYQIEGNKKLLKKFELY